MAYECKANLKEQNSRRITESKVRLAVSIGEGRGREKRIQGNADWSTWCVWVPGKTM